MKKMNKKGFTLIEMLVVIAIIAILVAIIIPVVTSSTDKAACATNAANLRSIKAEATTNYLMTGNATATSVVKSKACSLCAGNLDPVITETNGVITVTFDGKKIEDFANEAGKANATTPAKCGKPVEDGTCVLASGHTGDCSKG